MVLTKKRRPLLKETEIKLQEYQQSAHDHQQAKKPPDA
jgi:hypothetical protein